MRVLVTHHIPDAGLSHLREHDLEVVVLEGGARKKDIIRALERESYDGMVTLLTDMIDEEVFASVGSCMRVIANYAVGYNNIAVAEAKKMGIVVTNTPGVLTDTVAEHAFGLILSIATRVVEADSFVRAGKFTGWEPELFLGVDLKGKTLGILGAGRIGARVAELGHGFGMACAYYDVTRNADLEKSTGAVLYGSPEELLRAADAVSVHVPLNDATYHLLDARRIGMMKPTAILVNTSRGPVIDEQALIIALSEGRLFGAGLDVFEREPEVPRALRKLPNVVLTPHTASASIFTRDRMAVMAAENVIAVLHGGSAPHPVR